MHASDEDRALHDHPWSFVSILFHRGYWEYVNEPFFKHHSQHGEPQIGVRVVRHWRRRFSILWRPAEWAHRLELTKPTWTLVVRFRRRRMWGFFTEGGWMDWQAYGKEWCD